MSYINILNTIKQRRSTFAFKEQLVDEAILKDIFTYGSYAPTHYMKEPWNINLYQEKGKAAFVEAIIASYQRIGMLEKGNGQKTMKMVNSMSEFLLGIPHHALIYFEKGETAIRYEEDYAAVCAFIQNAQLAAWEYDVGMLWTITPYMHDPDFAEDIGLDGRKIKIAAVLQIGYPQHVGRNKGRTAIAEKLRIISD